MTRNQAFALGDEAQLTVEALSRDGFDLAQITKMTGLRRERVSEILRRFEARMKNQNRRQARQKGKTA